MEIKYEIITPEIAKKYLQRNSGNYRALSQSKVAVYAHDMESGRWETNGESIKFNKDGILVDGQHRLSAIVRSGCSIPMIVCYGIDNSVSVFDVGQGRTASQILKANGVPSPVANNTIAGMANLIISGSFSGSVKGATKVSKADCVEFVKNHSESISVAVRASDWNSPYILRKAPIVAAIFMLVISGYSLDTISSFCHIVNSGYSVEGVECSPCVSLRNLLMAHKARNAVSPKDRELEFCATVKAFIDFDSQVKRFKQYAPHDCTNIGLKVFANSRRLLGLDRNDDEVA